jgi:hypothetical protein
VEPIAQPATEPVAEPVTEPVTEPTTSPISAPVAEPTIDAPIANVPAVPASTTPMSSNEPTTIITPQKDLAGKTSDATSRIESFAALVVVALGLVL